MTKFDSILSPSPSSDLDAYKSHPSTFNNQTLSVFIMCGILIIVIIIGIAVCYRVLGTHCRTIQRRIKPSSIRSRRTRPMNSVPNTTRTDVRSNATIRPVSTRGRTISDSPDILPIYSIAVDRNNTSVVLEDAPPSYQDAVHSSV